MIITIDRSATEESQHPVITIDTKGCHYPYAIKNAIETALALEGHSNDFIDEVFGRLVCTQTCDPG
jgi:hypothetical protein